MQHWDSSIILTASRTWQWRCENSKPYAQDTNQTRVSVFRFDVNSTDSRSLKKKKKRRELKLTTFGKTRDSTGLFHRGSVTDSKKLSSRFLIQTFIFFRRQPRYGAADIPLNVAHVVIHIEFLHLSLSFKPKQCVSEVICTTPISVWSQLHSERVSNAIPFFFFFFLRPMQSA